MADHFERIPAELKSLPQWLVWRSEERDGKPSKVPYNAKNGRHAKSNDFYTWSDFKRAVATFKKGGYAGIGFAFKRGDGLVGLDIDHPWNSPVATEIREHFKGSYCERSPSNKLRVFCYGVPARCGKGVRDKRIEVYNYSSPRYLTTTGCWIDGTSRTVTQQQKALDWLHEMYFREEVKAKPDHEQSTSATSAASAGGHPQRMTISRGDQHIIDRARAAKNGGKFEALFNGNTAGYQSHSEADAALCAILAFQTQDEGQIDRIFRSTRLMRPKWDEKHHADGAAYGEETIRRALNTVTEFYQEDWPDPDPLIADLKPVAPFDFNMLPESIRPWIADIANRMQCAPDYPAVAVMVALSSVVGRKLGICPKQKDDWLVVVNLWGALIGRPSGMKTPTLNEALRPLRRLEIEAKRKYEEEALAAFNTEKMLHELKKEQAKKLAQEALKKGHDTTAKSLLNKIGEAPKKPIRQRFIVNDSTIEKLGELLNENPNGLLLARDELTGWLKTMEREDRVGDRAFYLEAWNGTGGFTYDRIGRGTIDIEATTVAIIGTIQPGRLRPYVHGAIKQGAGDDGLIQRFQLIVYPDQINRWKNIDQWPDKQSKDRAFELFNWLADFRIDQQEEGGIPYLRFDAEAQALFNEWRTELECRIRAEDIHPALESHLAKYRSLIPSLALIIHLADARSLESVGKIALLKALDWGEYLESHTERVYALATDSSVTNARLILKRIDQLPDPFKPENIRERQWSGLHNTETIIRALVVLEDHGYIRSHVIKQKAVRSSTVYFRHPSLKRGVLEQKIPEALNHTTRKPRKPSSLGSPGFPGPLLKPFPENGGKADNDFPPSGTDDALHTPEKSPWEEHEATNAECASREDEGLMDAEAEALAEREAIQTEDSKTTVEAGLDEEVF
jgi:Uncharacterized conserved protein